MPREGPGFLADIAIVWLIAVISIGLAELVTSMLRVTGLVDLIVSALVAVAVVIAGLTVYYKLLIE